jgi:hypothetical protein
MPTITDRGVPVTSCGQYATLLSPNLAEDGWNYIVCATNGGAGVPIDWYVIKNLTTTPIETDFQTTTHRGPSANTQIFNQLRASNGRIFVPTGESAIVYYEPTDESIQELPAIVETPPVDPNASTGFYSASFGTTGNKIYLGTYESYSRPACIVELDTATLAMTILGYVGEDAEAYTTYAYYIAPDTDTASKFIYIAYGQDPWQLWALDITPGPTYGDTTKLYEVGASGNISFNAIPGYGWRVNIHTNLGQPDDELIFKWMIDGALVDYDYPTVPPGARDVVPYENPLVDAPELDVSLGAGIVGWRFDSGDPYTYENYTVLDQMPRAIESLIASNDGIVGNAEMYSGFFQCELPTFDDVWYGPAGAAANISEGARLNVDGTIYMAGYPNGVMYSYDPDQPWASGTNPMLLGYVGASGTLYAGIKYATHMVWAAQAGVEGRLYVAGTRERNGVGAGIGYWDYNSGGFAGTYTENGMDTILPTGLCVLASSSRVVMATQLIDPPGTANLYVFDYAFNLIDTLPVINDLANLGTIYETSTPNVITGVVQGSGNSLGLWQYNVATETFIDYVELAITGTLGAQCQRFGGSVWVVCGDNLVRININDLTATVVEDVSSILPIATMAFSSDTSVLFAAAGEGSTHLYSIEFPPGMTAETGVGVGVGFDATLIADGRIRLVTEAGVGVGVGFPAALSPTFDPEATTGDTVGKLRNGESTTIYRGQPVYIEGNLRVRLAVADGDAVVGLVADAEIASEQPGNFTLGGHVVASPAEWDLVCGTTGGLTFGTTYYLHPSIPGRLTATAPTTPGAYVVPVIDAISSTEAVIVIKSPVLV